MLGLHPTTKVPGAPVSDYKTATPNQHRFSPYEENHGTVVAIAGDDFVVIASDTRLSGRGYNILTRNQPKTYQLSDKTVLGSTGCWCDVLAFCKMVEARMKIFKYTHNKTMSTKATAQMVSTMLYAKRFFPYYVSNIVVGLDSDGKGVVYSYDPVGHCEKTLYRAGGSSVALIQPLLDNQVGKKNMQNVDPSIRPTLDEALSLIHDSFISATEREIHTGDSIFFKIITKNGTEERTVGLRKD